MTLQDISIADAVTSDIPMLVSLLAELFSIEQDFQPNTDKQARGLQLLISSPDRGVIRVARNQTGEVIGMVSAQLVMSTAEGAPSAWVEDMVVGRDWRTQGVGRRLLNSALEWAKSKGATRAQLLVDLDNEPAINYYAHLGWQGSRLGARRIAL